jgi:hypothetical protein
MKWFYGWCGVCNGAVGQSKYSSDDPTPFCDKCGRKANPERNKQVLRVVMVGQKEKS